MKKAQIINKIILNTDLLSNIDRLYIGNDYCENNLKEKTIIKLCQIYQNKKITLLLPFLTDMGLSKLSYILSNISGLKLKQFEIVFNDWGTFFYLRTNYPKIKLVLGRLLTKQKKDPRAEIIINNKQDKFKLLKSSKGSSIIYTKKVPKTLTNIFYETNISTREYIDFLIENNVNRIEIDNLVWQTKLHLPKTIKASIYYPYVLLNVTRYCGAVNSKNIVCGKDCTKKRKQINDCFYMKGNSLYYKNEKIPDKDYLKENNIDRIVVQEI